MNDIKISLITYEVIALLLEQSQVTVYCLANFLINAKLSDLSVSHHSGIY